MESTHWQLDQSAGWIPRAKIDLCVSVEFLTPANQKSYPSLDKLILVDCEEQGFGPCSWILSRSPFPKSHCSRLMIRKCTNGQVHRSIGSRAVLNVTGCRLEIAMHSPFPGGVGHLLCVLLHFDWSQEIDSGAGDVSLRPVSFTLDGRHWKRSRHAETRRVRKASEISDVAEDQHEDRHWVPKVDQERKKYLLIGGVALRACEISKSQKHECSHPKQVPASCDTFRNFSHFRPPSYLAVQRRSGMLQEWRRQDDAPPGGVLRDRVGVRAGSRAPRHGDSVRRRRPSAAARVS